MVAPSPFPPMQQVPPMKKFLAYSLGALVTSALPVVAHAQFTLPNMQQNQGMIAPPMPMYQPPPQPTQFNQQTFGNQTFYNGTSGGQSFNGSSQTFGNTTFTHMQGANGSSSNCTQMRFGNQITTHCQ